MFFNLTVDMAGQPISAVLALVYAFADNNSKFSALADNKSIMTTLDGGKPLTQEEFDAVSSLPYVLSFAPPPSS